MLYHESNDKTGPSLLYTLTLIDAYLISRFETENSNSEELVEAYYRFKPSRSFLLNLRRSELLRLFLQFVLLKYIRIREMNRNWVAENFVDLFQGEALRLLKH